jgi:hypothetical protein
VHPLAKHRPAARLDEEQHHVLPRKWQTLWTPAKAPYPGVYHEFGVTQQLWDARTVSVPPTCHRNVHHFIVAVMRQLAAAGGVIDANAVTAAAKAVSGAEHLREKMALQELQWATEAPLRYLAAGGELVVLIAARAWGDS